MLQAKPIVDSQPPTRHPQRKAEFIVLITDQRSSASTTKYRAKALRN
jgi:hypothetical protein